MNFLLRKPMKYNIKRNFEGYSDPTAFEALKKIIQMEGTKKMKEQVIKRGDIFSMQGADGVSRNCIVVSSDERNAGRYVSIITLIDSPKGYVNVPLTIPGGCMYADCGLISYTKSENLDHLVRIATDDEMRDINDGIITCFGLTRYSEIEQETYYEDDTTVENDPAVVSCAASNTAIKSPDAPLDNNIIELLTEGKIYKQMYFDLINRIVQRGV